jgi:DNA-binding GntR family transcriptional regulator
MNQVLSRNVDKMADGGFAALPLGGARVAWLVEELGREITEGILKPGQKLNEPQLSLKYGVSRAPLREAISRLEGRRLVVRQPNRGARVATLEPAEFIQLFHVREGLEGIAARLSADRIRDAELRELDAICQAQAARNMADQAALELDMSFHHLIARSSGSSLLASILCEEFYVFYKVMRRRYPMLPQRQREADLQHVGIRDALRSRDGELAEFLMRRHIKGARDAFELAVETNEPKSGC